jgi:hypothetical protein
MPSPFLTAEEAFADVLAKARGGVVGAVSGVALALMVLWPDRDAGVLYGLGAIFGAAAGAIFSGRFIGPLSSCIRTGGVLGMLASSLGLFGARPDSYACLGLIAGGVVIGFAAGAGFQIWQASRMPASGTSQSDSQSARRLVAAEKRWIVVGGILGAAVFVCIRYFDAENYNYAFITVLAAVGGALLGSVTVGGRLGHLSRALCGFVIVALFLLVMRSGHGKGWHAPWNAIVIIPVSTTIGFTLGAMLESWRARRTSPK